MTRRFIVAAGVALLAISGTRAQQPPTQDLPVFRSSVELTSIDISAVDDRGRPVNDLQPEDFNVRIDGDPRRVVSAQWIALETEERPPAPAAPDGYTGNENATGGRLILLVVDQPNIRFGGTLAIRGAVNAFIDRLRPSDRTAVIGLGQGAVSTPFTADRARLKRAVERLVGQFQPSVMSAFTITLTEAMNIRRSVPGALEQVILRECAGMGGPAFESCQIQVMQEAQEKAMTGASDGQRTIAVLRAILTALRAIDAPKSLLFVSEGFLTDDQRQSVIDLGALAAAARTSIYALKLDDQLFASMASEARAPLSPIQDRMIRAEGLELLASASRGALFNVIGTGAGVFERIETELSGYYLLGVESNPGDRDGRAHGVRVEVKRKGVTVRARRAIVASDEGRPRSPRDAVAAAVESPLPVSALPLRVATFSLQGPETGKVQILIHADVGTDYASARPATIGFTISDAEGRVVDGRMIDDRLRPVMNGVPSALQFTAGTALPPGEYTLKLAVGEGDRLGTVEHTFKADVRSAGALKVSDLMVGGPVNGNVELLQPTVGYTVVFGMVHGYVEAYGDGASELGARFELTASEAGETLLSEEVKPFRAGSTRAIFSKALPVRQLPPGRYLLRAIISGRPGGTVQTLTRAFEVSAPAVLMTSAEAGAVLSTADVFLPVSDSMFGRVFDRGDLARSETLQAFRPRVAQPARAAFDAGVSALASGDLGKAETSFKAALGTDAENTAVLAYLAAVFAAAGRDDQASGAWQTALVDGSDFPQIYEWLSDALMRQRRFAEARGVLEEAVSKWPGDNRFAKPLALVYATFGQGPMAVRLMERHLDDHPDETEALQLAVEWLYHLKRAGAVARSPAQDAALARRYANAYAKTKGSQQALVRQWMQFIDAK